MAVTNKYVPGVCNIGPAERAKRRQGGYMGIVTSVLLLVVLYYFHAHRAWRLLLFFPVSMGAVGFLQDYLHFCVYFGMSGLFNLDKPAGQTESVELAEFRAKDRARAWQIIFYSWIIGAVVAIAACFI